MNIIRIPYMHVNLIQRHLGIVCGSRELLKDYTGASELVLVLKRSPEHSLHHFTFRHRCCHNAMKDSCAVI